jgi:cytochrome c5
VSHVRFIALAALGLALGAGCAAALPRPSAETVARAQGRWPDSTLEQLEHGRAVFAQRCAGCHALPLPDSKSEAEWKKVLDEMGAEAKLTSDERTLVERFILSVRTRAN